jgi:hypothetical protein
MMSEPGYVRPGDNLLGEKPRLWMLVNETWPKYDVYQSRTERDTPVVVISQASHG